MEAFLLMRNLSTSSCASNPKAIPEQIHHSYSCPSKLEAIEAIMNSTLAGAATKVLNATQPASLALRQTSSFAIARHKKTLPNGD